MAARFILALVATLAVTQGAYAADIDIADILRGEGDPNSNTYLNMIFGPLFPAGAGGGATETIISRLVAQFNLVFLTLGMGLVIYNVLVGVAQTAHDGKLFGKNGSSLWAPIRTVVAMGMLLPLPSGYNGVQHAIAYVTNVGTGTASYFWTETADAVVEQRVRMAGIDHQARDVDFISGLWRLEICRAAYNRSLAGGGGGLEPVRSVWETVNNVPTLTYKTDSVKVGCGRVTLPSKTKAFDRLSDGASYAQYVADLQGVIDERRQAIAAEATKVANAVASNGSFPLDREISTNYIVPFRMGFSGVLDRYLDRGELEAKIVEVGSEAGSVLIQPVDNEAAQRDAEISTSMKEGGWTQAGFYYQTIARISADSSSVASAMPSIQFGSMITAAGDPSGPAAAEMKRANSGFGNWLRGADTEEFLSSLMSNYAERIQWLSESAQASGLTKFLRTQAVTGDYISDPEALLPTAGQLFAMMQLLDPTKQGNVDPMIGVIQLGQAIVYWVTVAIGGIVLLGAVPFAGGSAQVLSSTVGWVISGIGVAAVTMAFILPMIPTLIWILAIGAFLMLIIQAVFAGPLWAIAHLSLDGDGLSGQSARRGYLMMLSIFVTPMLMIFGLLASMVLFRILATLLNGGIYLAMTGTQSLSSNGTMGLTWYFGMFVVLIFVVIAYVVIIEMSFRLISWLPNAVMTVLDAWISGIGVGESDVSGAQRAGAIAGNAGSAALSGANTPSAHALSPVRKGGEKLIKSRLARNTKALPKPS